MMVFTRNFLTFVNTTGFAYAAKTRCMRPAGKYFSRKEANLEAGKDTIKFVVNGR